MSKIAEYLQGHLLGEVSATSSIRNHFSTDASVYQQLPQVVVSPKNEGDIRKVARFVWQLAERGKILPIVGRGSGTDLTGSAIGQAITLITTPHMNQILEFDDKRGGLKVEPGVNFGRLQQMLSFSHGRYIPAYPDSYEYSTLGGAVVNNSGGEQSLMYGPMSNYVTGLRVVLANGDVIETKRISKKEMSKKTGLSTFEGEIYRAIDGILTDYQEDIKSMANTRSNTGYNLLAVREKDGSVDLTPLIVGSKGTLGIVTHITLKTELYRPDVSHLSVMVHDRTKIEKIVSILLAVRPTTCEYYDSTMLQASKLVAPNMLGALIGESIPAGIIMCDFPGVKKREMQKILKELTKHLKDNGASAQLLPTDDTETPRQLRRLTQMLMTRRFGSLQLVPGIDEVIVPLKKMDSFMREAEGIFEKHGIEVVINARAGQGIIHAYPFLDLSELGDRQRLMRIATEYYKLAISLGGSVAVEHGDGRARGSFARLELGDRLFEAMKKTKLAFDPFGVMNPGVKIDADAKENFALMRHEYDLPQLYNH